MYVKFKFVLFGKRHLNTWCKYSDGNICRLNGFNNKVEILIKNGHFQPMLLCKNILVTFVFIAYTIFTRKISLQVYYKSKTTFALAKIIIGPSSQIKFVDMTIKGNDWTSSFISIGYVNIKFTSILNFVSNNLALYKVKNSFKVLCLAYIPRHSRMKKNYIMRSLFVYT